MVLCPLALPRILPTSLGFMETAMAGWPAPYKTAGANPLTRKRRASFFPRVSRFSALTVISVFISLLPRALAGHGAPVQFAQFQFSYRKRVLTEPSSWMD